MSRTITRVLHGASRLAMIGQSPIRKAMTLSRLVAALEVDAAHIIQTSLGPLKTLPLRGPHLAAAAIGFDDEEPETLEWIRGFEPGEIFYDVGAATGLFSLYAALLPDVAVYAFEPKATSFGVLVEHLALNALGDRIFPLCVALSSVTEATRLTLSGLAPGTGGNSVGGAPDQFGLTHSVFSQGALAYRLDDLVATFRLPAPTQIKIDVDGLESEILKGSPLTLRGVKSVMLEVEGRNADEAAVRIDPYMAAAGLKENRGVRNTGSGRNRLFTRD